MSRFGNLAVLARTLADELADIGAHEPLLLPAARPRGGRGATDNHSLALAARRYLKLRRQRDLLFGADLFADPAWDILLDLFVGEVVNRKISVSSACIAAAVPPTTALRWIDRLTEEGLLQRVPDRDDRRRCHISLAPGIADKIATWLGALVEGGDAA